jgi:hypothetical protein
MSSIIHPSLTRVRTVSNLNAIAALKKEVKKTISLDVNRFNTKTPNEPAELTKVRQEVETDIINLVKETKLSWMERGHCLYLTTKDKNKQPCYFRLPKTRRQIEWCEIKSEGEVPDLLQTKNNIPITSLKSVSFAPATPQGNKRGGRKGKTDVKDEEGFHFSLTIQNEQGEEKLELSTNDNRTFVNWVDGIKVLLNQQMDMSETVEELDILMSLEFECRLIEAEGAADQPSFVTDSPVIPPPPTDFNFYYK